MMQDQRIVETDIPARLDRLPWGRFHTLVVVALGITWIFDGLEVTLAGSLAGALKESPSLRFSNTDIGLASSAYLAGAVIGAIFFGWLTDRLGRKKLFFLTLTVYLTATAATAFSWDIASFAFFRFLTGAGIGGEYSAINSTIQELVPARVRGWNDLVINGSFWIGAALGALGSLVLLDPRFIDPDFGWRLGFLTRAVGWVGAGLGLVLAVAIVPSVVGRLELTSDTAVFLLGAAGIVLLASLGQGIGVAIGSQIPFIFGFTASTRFASSIACAVCPV